MTIPAQPGSGASLLELWPARTSHRVWTLGWHWHRRAAAAGSAGCHRREELGAATMVWHRGRRWGAATHPLRGGFLPGLHRKGALERVPGVCPHPPALDTLARTRRRQALIHRAGGVAACTAATRGDHQRARAADRQARGQPACSASRDAASRRNDARRLDRARARTPWRPSSPTASRSWSWPEARPSEREGTGARPRSSTSCTLPPAVWPLPSGSERRPSSEPHPSG